MSALNMVVRGNGKIAAAFVDAGGLTSVYATMARLRAHTGVAVQVTSTSLPCIVYTGNCEREHCAGKARQ